MSPAEMSHGRNVEERQSLRTTVQLVQDPLLVARAAGGAGKTPTAATRRQNLVPVSVFLWNATEPPFPAQVLPRRGL